ncbi:MAG TPA: DUF2281 domain-containing protein [Flavipsychrobacter sp.]|nr:DUF2281 domain-containing protein [Flavipsychrobacter sp.]
MLTTIKGIYDHGKIVLSEQPPVKERTEVIVTFLGGSASKTERKLGILKGKISVPDDFDDPLDDLKEYMS